MDGTSSTNQGWQTPSGGQPAPPRSSGYPPAVYVGVGVIAVLAVAIVALLVTDGGSDDDTTTGQTPVETTTTAPSGPLGPDDVDLADALLTQDGLNGFTEHPVQPATPGEYSGGEDCDALISIMEEGDERISDAEAYFESDSSLAVTHRLDWVTDDLGDLEVYQQAMQDCPTYEFSYGSESAEFTRDVEVIVGLGDRAYGIANDGDFTAGDGTETSGAAYLVTWERDGVRATVSQVDLSGRVQPGVPHAATMRDAAVDLAQSADTRLAEVLQSE